MDIILIFIFILLFVIAFLFLFMNNIWENGSERFDKWIRKIDKKIEFFLFNWIRKNKK